MDQPKPRVGVNVFVLNEGKILFGKRIGKVGTGTWCLPGGHLEFGEHLSHAAARELAEETGIIATKLTFLQLINQSREGWHYVHINFFAEEWSGDPKVTEPDKFSAWEWFDIDNLPNPIFEGHQQFIPAFKKKVEIVD